MGFGAVAVASFVGGGNRVDAAQEGAAEACSGAVSCEENARAGFARGEAIVYTVCPDAILVVEGGEQAWLIEAVGGDSEGQRLTAFNAGDGLAEGEQTACTTARDGANLGRIQTEAGYQCAQAWIGPSQQSQTRMCLRQGESHR